MNGPLVVKTMLGMGDNLWSRPVVLALARQYAPLTLVTPWPQLYVDFARDYDVRFAPAVTRLRTQTRNIQGIANATELAPGIPLRWDRNVAAARDDTLPVVRSAPAFRLAYSPAEIRRGANHHDSLERSAREYLRGAGVSPLDIALQVPEAWQERADLLVEQWSDGKPVVLVRPPTVRTEWKNPARNCDPNALQLLVDLLAPEHTLVGFADLAPGIEWLERDLPNLHRRFYAGELPVETLLGLMRRCWTIGVNGFTVPMALAVGGYAYILFGGNYGHNAPSNLLHPAYDTSRFGYSEPDAPCRGCTRPQHACNKAIRPDRLVREFDAWRGRQNSAETAMGSHLTTREYGAAYYREHCAEGLDYLTFGGWQQRYARWLAAVLDWRRKNVLDIGCACGSIVRGFLHAQVRATGVDLNAYMIGLGQKHWPDMAKHLAYGDAASLTAYTDGSLDGLHCQQVAEHWHPEDVPRILAECRRVLRPGSLFFCAMDTQELYERQQRNPETEDPTHYCIRPMTWWLEQFETAGFVDRTQEYAAKLRAHPQSMLAGSTSDSPSKYDWDFVVMEAAARMSVSDTLASNPDVAVILGGAECVWDDFAALERLIGHAWDGIVVCGGNDLGARWPRRLDIWATLHPEKLPRWETQRRNAGLPGGWRCVVNRAPRQQDTKLVPWGSAQGESASSGLFAAQAARELCHVKRAVLCGVPLTQTPHFPESVHHHKGVPWLSANHHWRVCSDPVFAARLHGWLRSMSGRTRDLLGEPTPQWLYGEREAVA